MSITSASSLDVCATRTVLPRDEVIAVLMPGLIGAMAKLADSGCSVKDFATGCDGKALILCHAHLRLGSSALLYRQARTICRTPNSGRPRVTGVTGPCLESCDRDVFADAVRLVRQPETAAMTATAALSMLIATTPLLLMDTTSFLPLPAHRIHAAPVFSRMRGRRDVCDIDD